MPSHACGHLVVCHVLLHLVDAHLTPVEDAGSEGRSAVGLLEHLVWVGWQGESGGRGACV